MVAATGPSPALTASELMCRDVVTLSQDAPLRAAAELFLRRRIEQAVVVDTAGQYVGMLAATDLLHWALGEARGGIDDIMPRACPYQVRGRLLTGEDAVICTRTQGSCPLQVVQPMTGGRHTAVCRLGKGVVSDWQEVPAGGNGGAVRRYMTAGFTVEAEASLSALAQDLAGVHVPTLIVIDDQHRPIGIVSRLDVLAALVCRGVDGAER